jgi:hypothetical protein
MDTFPVCATGLTAPFLATSHAACCRRTGEVIWALRRARTVSDGRTLRLKKSGVGKIADDAFDLTIRSRRFCPPYGAMV